MTPHEEWKESNPDFVQEEHIWIRWDCGPFYFSLYDGVNCKLGDFELVCCFGEEGTVNYSELRKTYRFGARFGDVKRDGYGWAMEKLAEWTLATAREVRALTLL